MDLTTLAVFGLLIALVAAIFTLNRQRNSLVAYQLWVTSVQHSTDESADTMKKLKKRIGDLANISFDALLVVDDQRFVTFLNEAARELFNGAQHGQTLMTVTRAHQLDGLAQKAGISSDVLNDQIEIDGRAFKVRAARLEENAIALVLQDVTELLRLTRARRDMVANISHELRTPISTIRLLVDTLSSGLGRNPERDLKNLTKIAAETDSLQYLAQELHDLSMIESGKAIMRMIELPFNSIARDATDRLAAQLEKRKLTLRNMIEDDIRVLADPDQTRRVLMNVIGNALKFTPSGGTITVSANSKGGMVTIRIADDGPGIPPGERTRVFERFYQVDSARTSGPQGGGSGLGLSIGKHIIEAQGGHIWAEGVEPHGTCICFTLPLATAEAETSR